MSRGIGEAAGAQLWCCEPSSGHCEREGAGRGILLCPGHTTPLLSEALSPGARGPPLFPLAAPCLSSILAIRLRAVPLVLFLLSGNLAWPLSLPARGIGFGNNSLWDRKAVPWNPSGGHRGCRRKVGLHWLVGGMVESHPHAFISWNDSTKWQAIPKLLALDFLREGLR